jgi:NADH:ubiquinone oxidoreductase subunit K
MTLSRSSVHPNMDRPQDGFPPPLRLITPEKYPGAEMACGGMRYADYLQQPAADGPEPGPESGVMQRNFFIAMIVGGAVLLAATVFFALPDAWTRAVPAATQWSFACALIVLAVFEFATALALMIMVWRADAKGHTLH